MAKEDQVVNWLLEADQPSVRYYTLVDILGRKDDDPDVREARTAIPWKGWAKDILQAQKPEGHWEPKVPSWDKETLDWLEFMYRPFYTASNWRALILSDLGLTSKEPGVKKVAELFFRYKLQLSSPVNIYTEESCRVGNAARMLTRFGYGEDFRVRKLYDWLLEDQREDGGWHCLPGKPGTLDCWEALAALAVLPKQKRTRSIKRSIERGAEFYLERKLFEEGQKYPPWFRFHYPNHYFYDILIGLDLMTKLGYSGDSRLGPALKILKDKRQPDGTWLLDKIHPDHGPGVGSYVNRMKFELIALEQEGAPSKWITLTALRALNRAEASR
jgi:Prenyltransferase and squalene oxidase repeat